METALRAKFTQNPELAELLLNTGDNLIIEANPSDKYWSCGLSLFNADIWNPTSWIGKNTLGYLLMKIRAEISKT